MNILSIIKGAQKVANNLNKGLYSVFGGFVEYFNTKMTQIRNNPFIPAHPDVDEDKLMQAAIEVMNEFEAPERNRYTQKAFDRRAKAGDDIVLPKGVKGTLISLIHKFHVQPDLIKRMRTVAKDMRLDLLGTCEHSLTGFQSLIFAVQSYREGKPVPEFDLTRLDSVGIGGVFSPDDRDILSGMIEELKELVAQHFFYREIQGRMMRGPTTSLSAHTIAMLGNLQTLLRESHSPEKLSELRKVLEAEVGARFRAPVAAIPIVTDFPDEPTTGSS